MITLKEMSSPSGPKSHSSLTAVPKKHQASHSEAPELHRPSKTLSKTSILAIFVIIVGGFAGLFFAGSIPRQHSTKQLLSDADRVKTTLPLVRVMRPNQSPAIAVVNLPGDAQAMEETAIYPRTNGYVKRWLVDIGDEVESGQLIAEIDTPEVSAQLQQSEAALAESVASLERARATVDLTTITTNRLRILVQKKNAAQQDLDDAENSVVVAKANVRLAEATIEANKANVQHMRELFSFSEIHAPFSGTVIARHLETGKLVTAGNGTGQALFQIARTNPIRVFIHVPQIYAPGVVKDMKAEILSREFPGRIFYGTVSRTARAIDPLTRTLLTEIQVPNDDHALLTGSYVQVRMEVERQSPPLLIPASALIFNAAGTQVAVVGPDHKIQLRAVQVEGDFGSQIGISTGISPDEQIVINPGDRMSHGAEVEIETDQLSKAPDGSTKTY